MGNCMGSSSQSQSTADHPTNAAAGLSGRAPQTTFQGSLGRGTFGRKGKRKSTATDLLPGQSAAEEAIAMAPALDALRVYATLPHPASSLPANKLLLSCHNAMAVFDAYPKAKYHFLVLPRFPFPPQSDPESGSSIVSLEALDDLRSLLLKANKDAREDVLNAMANMAREVEEMIKDEMLKTEGFEWKVDIGFHAIPSMKHIHLHVISDDRISPALKTKKHHNSFRPDLGFFIPIMEVQRWIEDDSMMRERVHDMSNAERLLDTPLTCHKCDEFLSNIPKLKAHLEQHFIEERDAARKHIARHGRQKSSDEEVF